MDIIFKKILGMVMQISQNRTAIETKKPRTAYKLVAEIRKFSGVIGKEIESGLFS